MVCAADDGAPAPDARRISDQVVLLTRVGVLEQQADPDGPVIHRGGGVLGGRSSPARPSTITGSFTSAARTRMMPGAL